MPQQPINPFTAPLAMVKQLGEQANLSLQTIGTGMAQTASQGIDTLMAVVPPLPGVAPPARAGAPLIGQGLLPGNLTQVLSQLENVLIPPGLPRPTQVLNGAPPPAPMPTPTPTPKPTAQRLGAPPTRERVAERRGF